MSYKVYCVKCFIKVFFCWQRKVTGGFKWIFILKIACEFYLLSFVAALSKLNKYSIKPERMLIQSSQYLTQTTCHILFWNAVPPVCKTQRRKYRIPAETRCSLSLGAAGSGQMEGTYCSLMKVAVYRLSCGEKGQVVWLKSFENKATCPITEPLALSGSQTWLEWRVCCSAWRGF